MIFPNNYPSSYRPGLALLNFSDRKVLGNITYTIYLRTCVVILSAYEPIDLHHVYADPGNIKGVLI